METKIRFPDEMADVLDKPIEKSILELIVVGLYRDGKITQRQAADFIGVNMKRMLKLLGKHETYINYGIEELQEDIEYANSGE